MLYFLSLLVHSQFFALQSFTFVYILNASLSVPHSLTFSLFLHSPSVALLFNFQTALFYSFGVLNVRAAYLVVRFVALSGEQRPFEVIICQCTFTYIPLNIEHSANFPRSISLNLLHRDARALSPPIHIGLMPSNNCDLSSNALLLFVDNHRFRLIISPVTYAPCSSIRTSEAVATVLQTVHYIVLRVPTDRVPTV